MAKMNDEWEGTTIWYIEELQEAARKGREQCYQFGNCRFDCKSVGHDRWDVHAYDTDGNDRTFEGMNTIQTAGMMHDLFNTWGSGRING